MMNLKTRLVKLAGTCALLAALPFAQAEPVPSFNWHSPKLTSNVWKVSKPGQPDSYLLGTLHLGLKNKPLSKQAKALLAKTDKLVTEVDMLPDEKAVEEMGAYMGQQMISPNSLRTALGEKEFANLKRHFERSAKLSVFLPVLENLQPWAAVMLMMEYNPKGYSAENGVDILLSQAAKKAGKPRGSLENVQDVFHHFSSIPSDLALAMLKSMVKYHTHDTADIRTLHRLYAQNRFKDIPAFMDKNLSKPRMKPEEVTAARKWMEQDLIAARNRAWMPEIQKNVDTQKTLIAVGIGHLASQEGLIEQLRRKGYTVTPEPALKTWH